MQASKVSSTEVAWSLPIGWVPTAMLLAPRVQPEPTISCETLLRLIQYTEEADAVELQR